MLLSSDVMPPTSRTAPPPQPRTRPDADTTVELPARVTLFGHDGVDATVEVIPRSTGWRLLRTARMLGAFLVIVPLVGVIPPHAPWIAGAVTIAAILARRRWTERFTIADFQAPCPRCDHDLKLRPGTRLRFPHPIPCDECGHEPIMTATPPA